MISIPYSDEASARRLYRKDTLGTSSLCKKNIRARFLLMGSISLGVDRAYAPQRMISPWIQPVAKKGEFLLSTATLLVASCLAPAKFEQRNVRIGLRN